MLPYRALWRDPPPIRALKAFEPVRRLPRPTERTAARAPTGSEEASRSILPEDLIPRNENGCDRRVRPHPPPRRSGGPPGCLHPGGPAPRKTRCINHINGLASLMNDAHSVRGRCRGRLLFWRVSFLQRCLVQVASPDRDNANRRSCSVGQSLIVGLTEHGDVGDRVGKQACCPHCAFAA